MMAVDMRILAARMLSTRVALWLLGHTDGISLFKGSSTLAGNHLTDWRARGSGSILRATHWIGRHRDIAPRHACASERDHLQACVHSAFPSSTVCRDLACTQASARGAAAALRTPRVA